MLGRKPVLNEEIEEILCQIILRLGDVVEINLK